MAITRKGTAWELINSWYILFTFVPFGALSFCAFLYLWIRVRILKYLIATVIYLAGVVVLFWILEQFPGGTKTYPNWADWLFGISVALWPISFIHSILVRKEFLLRLEALEDSRSNSDSTLRSKIRRDMGVSKNPVNDVLVDYTDTDLSVKVCRAILNNLPFAPNFDSYTDVAGAVLRVNPSATQDQISKAEKIAERDDGILKVVKTGIAIDRIDGGLGIYTGIKNSYDAIKNKDRERTFEADPQQAADASLKALALGYMITVLFDGSPADRVRSFLSLRAGQEALIYYAAVEVALPFTDNLVDASSGWMSSLLVKTSGEAEKRFGQFAQGESLEMTKGILTTLTQTLDTILDQTRNNLKPFIDKTTQVLPSIMNITDSVTGGVATALDLLPIWKLLSARIAAEAAAVKGGSLQ
ncbi:MAG: hypothetical protein H3C43_12870 [Leptonema sp. (in: Bacteria)]|nr:hypothetical protein [Leptonema sp. (in: bacteria)]